MDRRDFLKTILGGLTIATVAPSLIQATPAQVAPKPVSFPVWDGSTLTLLPESSKVEATNVHYFPDSWIHPLQIAHAPTFMENGTTLLVQTRKTKIGISLEFLQDWQTIVPMRTGLDEWLVLEVMKELKEHNYRYFHSIIMTRYINPTTFKPAAGVLVRGVASVTVKGN